MTREEAIELLEDLDGAIEDNHGRDYDEAFRMAIESLSAEPSDLVFRGGKIPPKEMLGGTVLIPKHQWLEMERELAELKSKFESAEPCKSADQNVADVPSGDLISRQDAIECLPNGLCYDSDGCVKALSALPSADRPKGENHEID